MALALAGPVAAGAWGALGAWAARPDAGGLVAGAVAVAALASVAHLASRGRPAAPWAPALAGAVAAGPIGLALGGSAAAAALAGLGVAAGSLLPALTRWLPEALDGLAARRPVLAASLVALCLAVGARTATLSVFMADPSRPELSMAPELPFVVGHSCLTAYVEGARLAEAGVPDLYAAAHWPDLLAPTEAGVAPPAYAPFKLDAYAYPPTFLVWPHFLLSPLPDFAARRAVWFALNALALALGLGAVARWLGGDAGLRALALAPLIWGSQLVTLQVGNVHPLVVVAAMLAFVAFEARRPALGGALLSVAILAKLSPAVVVVVLLARSELRAMAWTAAFGLASAALAVALFGVDPLVAFVTGELPRLGSGEALPFLAGRETVVLNLSPFGAPFKLELLGFEVGDPWVMGRRIGRVFTVAVLVLAAVGAVRAQGRRARLQAWAALLTLAALQSPLAPPYVLLPALWLLSVAAAEVRGAAGGLALAALWITLTAVPASDAPAWVGLTLLQAGLAAAIPAAALVRRGPPEADGPVSGGR